MKRLKILFLFLPLFLLFNTNAQGSLELSIKVLDMKGRQLPNAKISLVETKSKAVEKSITNALGIAKFNLTFGNKWKVFINGMDMDKVIKVPKAGNATQNITETYDKIRANRLAKQNLNRTGFKNKVSTLNKDMPSPKGYTTVQVLVTSRAREPHPNKKVTIVNHVKKLSYTAITDARGIARFSLPNLNNYDIDVESMLNAGYIDIGNWVNKMKRSTIFFETYYAKEEVHGDTIIQDLGGREDPTSSHAFFTVRVIKGGSPAVNEMVYLQEINGTQLYTNPTNNNGEVNFLLPHGKKFMIHLDYERDVDAINLMKFRGFATGEIQVNYRPRPELEFPEKFIPKPNELFLVDFNNFIEKQYPKPKSPKVLNLFLKWAGKVNANSKEAVLEVGYTAGMPNNVIQQNICFVLDVSGSMSGYYRIERLKEAMAKMIPQMNPETFISIITYESEMKVLLPPTKLGNKKSRIVNIIKNIEANGGTDMLEAMKEGYQFVQKNYLTEGSNRIIILTDGYDQNEIDVLVKAQAPFNSKVVCNTVGVGKDYNYPLLKQLASNGKGMLHFIGESADFDSVFIKNLGVIISPTAVNATLEVEHNEKIVYNHLYGYKETSKNSNLVSFNLPDIYSGANEVALVKFDLIKPDEKIEKQPVIIRLKYFEKGRKKTQIIEEKAFLEWNEFTGEIELITEAETKKLFCMAIMNQSLKVMAESYTSGDNNKASNTLKRTKTQVKKLYPKAKDKDINQLLTQLDKYISVFKNLELKEVKEKRKKP